MSALAEEYARRTMELRHHHALGTVDHKSALFRHIRDRTQIHILDHRIEILVIGVCTIKLQLGLQRHAVGQTTLQTLLNRIAGRVDIVVEKFEHEVIAGVRDREVFREDLVQALIVALLGRSVKLQEVLERLQLHLQKVRIRQRVLHRSEVYARFFCCY